MSRDQSEPGWAQKSFTPKAPEPGWGDGIGGSVQPSAPPAETGQGGQPSAPPPPDES